jgi:hypothetical protein
LGISLLYLSAFIGNFITLPWEFHWESHYYTWAPSLGISLLYLGEFHWEFHYFTLGNFIGNFITLPWGFHWEFHYYTWAPSLGISLLYLSNFIIIPEQFHWEFHYFTLGNFIGNFIIIPEQFHWEFHYFTLGISLGISLLYLGTFIGNFIGNFIIIPEQFHCNFHCCTRGISLGLSLLYLGNFIVIFIAVPGEFHCKFHIILIIEHVVNHAWVGAASKQTSTMPDVAVGWLRSPLGMLGAEIGVGNFIFRCSGVRYTHLECFGTPGGAGAGAKSFENGFHQSVFPN